MDTSADVVEQYAPLNKGHITTRQNIHIHHVPLRDAAALIREISDAGLSSREGCGNTVRNVTRRPVGGRRPRRAVRRHALRGRLRALLRAPPHDAAMPRKVKTALTGSDDDRAITGIHDVAFIARERDGVKGFELRIGGGTSIMPRIAPTLIDFVRADDGEYLNHRGRPAHLRPSGWLRANRARARIKVLVDKVGIEAVRETVEEELRSDWSPSATSTAAAHVPARRGGQRAAKPHSSARPTATAPSPCASARRRSAAAPARLQHRPGEGPARRPGARQFRELADIMRKSSGGYATTTVDENLLLRWGATRRSTTSGSD